MRDFDAQSQLASTRPRKSNGTPPPARYESASMSGWFVQSVLHARATSSNSSPVSPVELHALIAPTRASVAIAAVPGDRATACARGDRVRGLGADGESRW